MSSPTKEVSSPVRRPKRGEKEEETEVRAPTKSERKVNAWSDRVQRKLDAQFPTPVAGAEGAAAIRKRLPPTFQEEDATQSLTYKFHENALKGKHLEDNMMFTKLRARLMAFYVQLEQVKTLGKDAAIIKADKNPA
jgi:hypothetical protein